MLKSLNKLEIDKSKSWLIIGKGPSFTRIWDTKVSNYNLFGLNEVVTKINCKLGHIIDLDVAIKIGTTGLLTAENYIVPYHPHVNFRPEKTITSYYDKCILLKSLAIKDRLYTYNLSTYKGNILHANTPYIKTKYFSVEAAFRILANFGIRVIHTLGIDGGTKYASEFDDLKPLTNGRKSFDDQFIELRSICKQHSMSWICL